MADRTVQINRAPVLTLWAGVVAERLGFQRQEALSLGKAVAGLTAQVKGRRLGIYQPVPGEIREARRRKRGEEFRVAICGRSVPAITTADGVRAVIKGRTVATDEVERYLAGKFGESLPAARRAMTKLAGAFSPAELTEQAFRLYEQFRPSIPAGVRGWGARGELSVEKIEALRP